jgi:hypothetical protein
MATKFKTRVTPDTLDTEITENLREIITYSDGSWRPAWLVGIEVQGYSYSLDIESIHEKWLENSLELHKCHFYLDSHNWSDIERAVAEARILLLAQLLFRKRGA